jgi:CheY-like chemotaxis protein
MPYLWLVGTFEGTDATDVPAWSIAAFPGAIFRRFDTPRLAANWTGDPADVIVVVQHRPREFAPSEIAALIASQPLAQFIVGLGAWCGSSGRSEAAWAESITIPVWDLRSGLSRIARELEQGDVSAPWQTSGRDEVFLGEQEFLQRRAGYAGRVTRSSSHPAGSAGPTVEVIVESPDRILRETLCDIVADLVHAERAASTSSLVLWDADPLPVRLTALTELRQQRQTARIVALVDQPTRATIDQLKRAGANDVVAKPFRAAELRRVVGAGTERSLLLPNCWKRDGG